MNGGTKAEVLRPNLYRVRYAPYVINAIAYILGVDAEDVEAVGWRNEWGTEEPRACAKLLENYGRARGRREGRSREKELP